MMSVPSKSTSKEHTTFIQRVTIAFVAFILLCLLIGVGQHAIASAIPEEQPSYEEIDAYFSESFHQLLKTGNSDSSSSQ